jgi:hypothetical protein
MCAVGGGLIRTTPATSRETFAKIGDIAGRDALRAVPFAVFSVEPVAPLLPYSIVAMAFLAATGLVAGFFAYIHGIKRQDYLLLWTGAAGPELRRARAGDVDLLEPSGIRARPHPVRLGGDIFLSGRATLCMPEIVDYARGGHRWSPAAVGSR